MKRFFIFLAFILCIPNVSLLSQEDEMPRPGLERLEEFRKLRLLEILNLKEETAVRFFARYKEHRDAQQKYLKERIRLSEELRTSIKADAKDADIMKKIDEISEIDKRMIVQRWEAIRSLSDILTTKQIAKLILFEQRFNQEVLRGLRNRGKKPGGFE